MLLVDKSGPEYQPSKTSVRTKWFKHVAIQIVQGHLPVIVARTCTGKEDKEGVTFLTCNDKNMLVATQMRFPEPQQMFFAERNCFFSKVG